LRVEDRRTRLFAFFVITLVFVFSMIALIYWAVNVASAKISSRAIGNVQPTIPTFPNASNLSTQGLATTPNYGGKPMFSPPF
jgi:hypothetical protein